MNRSLLLGVAVATIAAGAAHAQLPNLGGDVGNFLEQRRRDLQNAPAAVAPILRPLDPREQARALLDLSGALASGNPERISQATGAVLLSNPACLGCRAAAEQIAPNLSAQQVNRIVGTGYLTFLLTGDPVLVILSVGGQYATEVQLSSQQAEGPPVPIPTASAPAPRPPRQPVTYRTTATCIISRNGRIWAGFNEMPSLSRDGGRAVSVADADIRADDVVDVSGPVEPCPGYRPPVESLSAVRLRYSALSLSPNDQNAMKFWLVGGRM